MPASVVRELQATSVGRNLSTCDVSAVCDVGMETEASEVEDITPESVDTVHVWGVEVDPTVLLTEQEQDVGSWLHVGAKPRLGKVDLWSIRVCSIPETMPFISCVCALVLSICLLYTSPSPRD